VQVHVLAEWGNKNKPESVGKRNFFGYGENRTAALLDVATKMFERFGSDNTVTFRVER
jgi:hypothetical protein